MRDILLVGSVGLADADTVFAELGKLAPYLKRVPDGETGERTNWTQWQHRFINEVDGLEVVSVRMIQGGLQYPQFRIKAGTSASDLKFGRLGFKEVALESYEKFVAARRNGMFQPDTKFQVSLPTSFAIAIPFFVNENVSDVWPVYEKRLFEEVNEICVAIPREDLAIQWDVACEIHRVLEVPGMPEKYAVADGIVRAIDAVPASVDVGIHLCYGDPGHKHILEPRDSELMVDLSNDVIGRASRAVQWLHMPVPRDRDDDAYFAPLSKLRLPLETQLFLGLIHLTDGLEGTRRRMATANKVISEYGIATECGFGRRPPETILSLIDLHRVVAQER